MVAVKSDGSRDFALYITDKNGIPFPIKEGNGTLVHNLLQGLNVGDYIHLTRSEKLALDDLISNGNSVKLIKKIAGENISSGMAVVVWKDDKIYKYNTGDINHAGISCGVSKTSALIGEQITIVPPENQITEVGSGWSAGNSYYVGSNSLLTTIPPISGISKKIATGIGIDTVIINNYPEHILL
jgi:hypothetical protein